MATVFQTPEKITLSSNPSIQVDVYWWKTTNNDISIKNAVVSGMGTAVSNWTSTTAVNGPFFPNNGINNTVNAFAINASNWVISGSTINFEDAATQLLLTF